MADEDDDLLRAAEELGIDLSGVRAGDGQAADENVEGTDDTDASDDDGGEPEAEADEAPDLDVDAEIDLGDLSDDVPVEDEA
jgi:DNA-directed RNA polymerase subunit beta